MMDSVGGVGSERYKLFGKLEPLYMPSLRK